MLLENRLTPSGEIVMASKKAPRAKKTAEKMVSKKAAVAPATPAAQQDNINAIGGVQLTMTAELGRTRQTLEVSVQSPTES